MTEVAIEIDEDGAAATRRAHATDGRSAVWVGNEDDEELAEFRAEIERRCR